jgi:hypothetical protein
MALRAQIEQTKKKQRGSTMAKTEKYMNQDGTVKTSLQLVIDFVRENEDDFGDFLDRHDIEACETGVVLKQANSWVGVEREMGMLSKA